MIDFRNQKCSVWKHPTAVLKAALQTQLILLPLSFCRSTATGCCGTISALITWLTCLASSMSMEAIKRCDRTTSFVSLIGSFMIESWFLTTYNSLQSLCQTHMFDYVCTSKMFILVHIIHYVVYIIHPWYPSSNTNVSAQWPKFINKSSKRRYPFFTSMLVGEKVYETCLFLFL